MYQEFNAHGVAVPLEVERSLELLHSYVIVRMHIRSGHHLIAARLLIRVAQSISKFPARKHSFIRNSSFNHHSENHQRIFKLNVNEM